jgi:hypothetical protein
MMLLRFFNSELKMKSGELLIILYVLAFIGLPILLVVTGQKQPTRNLRSTNTQSLGLLLLS